MRTNNTRNIFFLIALLSGISTFAQNRIPEVEKLLEKMTLEEKIGQLNLLTPGGGVATGAVVSEDVEKKIKSAFCPAKVVENNPVLAICKYHVFPRMEAGMTIRRPEKFGGDVHYDNYEQLEADFVSGAMHPMDLKKACADCMIEILAPVREKMKV